MRLLQQPPQHVPLAFNPQVVYQLQREFAGYAWTMANRDVVRLERLGSAVDKLTVMFLQYQVTDVAEMRRLYTSTLQALSVEQPV